MINGRYNKVKTAIIGCGHVGTQAAFSIASGSLSDIVLYDIVEGLPKGRALDLSQASHPLNFNIDVDSAESIEDILDSDIFVITAGKPRKPGMSRSDLLKVNASIIDDLAGKLKESNREAVFIIVTNPLDAMVTRFTKKISRNRKKVFGMGGVLDSARFSYFISKDTGAEITEIEGRVLGPHSKMMVPCFSITRVGHKLSTELLTKAQQKDIAEKTRYGGAEIVSYLKDGSAFLAPGASIARLIKAIVRNEHSLLPVSVLTRGEYGFSGVSIGIPAVIGREGIVRTEDIKLAEEELAKLKEGFRKVKELVEEFE